MKKIVFISSLILLSLQSHQAFSGEILDGDAVAKMLVGNTLQMVFRSDTERSSHLFHEYYDKNGKIYGMERRAETKGNYTHFVGSWEVRDGKFCTSVLGRIYACHRYEKVDDTTYKLIGERGAYRNVKLYKGKHHIVN